VTTRATKDGSWGTPANLGPMVNSSAWDSDAVISADGLSLFLASYRRGGTGGLDIFVATRTSASEPFGTPIDISANYEGGPCISPDGLELFFDSDRPGGYGYEDLWVATRETTDANWSAPINLGSTVNSLYGELGPRISPDGLSLFFSSHRPGGSGDYDIWMTTRATTQDSWTTPVNLGSVVNSQDYDHCATISPDGLELFFASSREADYGLTDIWVSTRATREDDWGEPINLGPTINTSGNNGTSTISSDELELYFTSANRPGGHGSNDIWVSTRETKHSKWGPAINLGPPVNTAHEEFFPMLSADGLSLFFSSGLLGSARPGGLGGSDIWMARRNSRNAEWSEPVNLGSPVNSSDVETAPFLSADDRMLYFDVGGGPGGSGDLWQVKILPVVDFNADGIVDSLDVCMMVDHWHTDEPLYDIAPLPYGDGIVDVKDLVLLAEHLTKVVEDPNEPNLP